MWISTASKSVGYRRATAKSKLINKESAKTARYRIRSIMEKQGVSEEEALAIRAEQRKREVVPSKRRLGKSYEEGQVTDWKAERPCAAGW